MRTYENKDELKNEINKSFAKYISEFNDIPEPLKDKRGLMRLIELQQKILLIMLDGQRLFLNGKQTKERVFRSKLPSDNFKWNQLGELYQWFTDTYALSCHCKS